MTFRLHPIHRMSLLLLLLFLPLAGCAGLAAGWWLRPRYARTDSQAAQQQNDIAQQSLSRLHDLTHRMSVEVGEHATIVRRIGDELRVGNHDSTVVDAVTQLIEANQRMQTQLNQADERLQAQARQIETSAHEARTDALTQVANRRSFDDELRRCVGEFRRRGRPTSLLLIDVDHFKRFNDTQGHQAGDEILRGVARVVRQAVSETEIVARYGGEEFAILFSGSSLTAARNSAERARRAIAAATFTFQGRELRVTASGGLAELLSSDDEKSLVRRADEALYAGKHNGRNCAFWNDGETNHRLVLESPRSAGSGTSGLASLSDVALGLSAGSSPATEQNRDPAAALPARAVFFDDVVRRLAHWKRGGTPLSLVLFQVDGFSRITAESGNEVAGRIARVAVQLMKASMRDMDHVAQLSDDTFALLLPGSKLQDSTVIAERIRANVERCRLPRQAGIMPFTVSVGCVEAIDGDDMRRIMERARKALEAAIQQGRNCTFIQDGNVTRPAGELAASGR